MLLSALRLACPPHPPTAGHHPQLSGGALLLPAAGKGKPLKRQRSAQKKEAEDGEEEGGAEKGALRLRLLCPLWLPALLSQPGCPLGKPCGASGGRAAHL